jgi:hypothetical protein
LGKHGFTLLVPIRQSEKIHPEGRYIFPKRDNEAGLENPACYCFRKTLNYWQQTLLLSGVQQLPGSEPKQGKRSLSKT